MACVGDLSRSTVYYINRTLHSLLLTEALVHVSEWLKMSDLHLNINKTVCMFFSKRSSIGQQADVFIEGEKLMVVSDFKYLGII